MPDTKASNAPPGSAIVERVGWEGERFTATLVFPNGVPDLPFAVVWRSVPVWLTPTQRADDPVDFRAETRAERGGCPCERKLAALIDAVDCEVSPARTGIMSLGIETRLRAALEEARK